MNRPPYILGGYQPDFARVWSRQGLDISEMIREATLGALPLWPVLEVVLAAPRGQQKRGD